MSGREGPEVAGFLERNLRGRVKRESDCGREGGREGKKKKNVKCFTKNFKRKYFFINLLRLI